MLILPWQWHQKHLSRLKTHSFAINSIVLWKRINLLTWQLGPHRRGRQCRPCSGWSTCWTLFSDWPDRLVGDIVLPPSKLLVTLTLQIPFDWSHTCSSFPKVPMRTGLPDSSKPMPSERRKLGSSCHAIQLGWALDQLLVFEDLTQYKLNLENIHSFCINVQSISYH